ncbi:MAG: glycoside hydrolase family 2 protein [Prevotella sp.]|nr:glycoside hydrolase family 2 protein [Prevotella sp.]MDY2893648.1 glycoside hydrolase family 2 protein [Prevotella sp.]
MTGKDLACSLATCIASLTASAYEKPQVCTLHTNWTFCQVGDTLWSDAKVPGTVHQDLLNHNRIPNPFYGMNEEAVQWVENEDWMYRTSFVVNEQQLSRDAAVLEMDGLDTYADVFLNGALILRSDNMFVGHKIEVKPVLRKGVNQLLVRFRSPVKEVLPQLQTNGFDYPASNDHSPWRTSVYTRKAPYSYGWDWGIRLATCGIWRPVRLVFSDVARIEDYYVCQDVVTQAKADVDNRLEINNVTSSTVSALLKVDYHYSDSDTKEIKKQIELRPGANTVSLPVSIEKPHLWMPNGWGEPSLYKFTASLSVDGVEIAKQERNVGLRTVRVVMDDDEYGKSFYFVVNGKPMFAKGANFIPDDALLPNVTPERYKRIFEDVKAANMNMLRVWGGGIYEDDEFYDEADRNGILIWQDFMFACSSYPHDPQFVGRVEAEAEYNIKRLRGHASLAMWCGNNEIYEAMRYWGWQRKYSAEAFAGMERGYDVLFRGLLPKMVERLDNGRFYMHSSPYEANWGRPDSWKTADSHNWGTWHGRKPFESFDTDVPRFMSEYGFQAFPEMKTIRTFAEEKDFELESPVMNAHQKADIGNALIKQTMGLYYMVPEKFEDLVYVGMVLQGQGIRHGIEAHRRNRPYCMGSLFWQLNDSWPVVSWSGIDYYGNWKALMYQSKRAFAPILINAIKEGDDVCVYLVSDELQDRDDVRLDVELMDFDGKVHGKWTQSGMLAANSSVLFMKKRADELQGKLSAANSLLHFTMNDKNGVTLADDVFYFAYPKDQKLPEANIETSVRRRGDAIEMTLKTDKLARDIFVEVPVQGVRFTDNFFDLLPGQRKKITITSPEGHSLNDFTFRLHQLGGVR